MESEKRNWIFNDIIQHTLCCGYLPEEQEINIKGLMTNSMQTGNEFVTNVCCLPSTSDQFIDD